MPTDERSPTTSSSRNVLLKLLIMVMESVDVSHQVSMGLIERVTEMRIAQEGCPVCHGHLREEVEKMTPGIYRWIGRQWGWFAGGGFVAVLFVAWRLSATWTGTTARLSATEQAVGSHVAAEEMRVERIDRLERRQVRTDVNVENIARALHVPVATDAEVQRMIRNDSVARANGQ